MAPTDTEHPGVGRERTRFVVAGVGVAGWDAGTDLFLDVARRLAADPAVGFIWAGRRSRGAARSLELDAALMGLDGRLSWVADPAMVDAPDVLVVTAREAATRDATLRDAGADIAVVCFAPPGAEPTLRAGLGVVPFADTVAMAGRVRAALDDGRDRPR